MSKEPLRVVLIGAGGFGRWTLGALEQLQAQGEVQLVGLSDRDPAVAERHARSAHVPCFTDNRSLLAETRPQAAFLAVPPMAVPELLNVCAERGIHVWKELPLARNLEEAAAFVRRMESAGLKFAVAAQWRFSPGYRRARELAGALEGIFLARIEYLFNWGPDLAWRGDRASAGGGALLELGYHAVDMLLWLMGMPEEVYGVWAGGHRGQVAPGGHALPPYDTDDTAAAVLRFDRGRMASLVVSRYAAPVCEGLWLHGRGGAIRADREHCSLRDPEGTILEDFQGEPQPGEAFCRQVQAFVRAIQEDAACYENSALENLLTMAVLEAIYLADRTSQPEKPADLLRVHGLSIEKCLARRGDAEAPA